MIVLSRRFLLAFAFVAAISGGVIAAPLKLTLVKHDQDRRYVVVEKQVPTARLAAPFKLTDEAGKSIPCQWEPSADGNLERFVLPEVPANQAKVLTLDQADSAPSEKSGITIKDVGGGSWSIANADHEITRYNVGPLAEKFKKPYFYPVMAEGVSVTRAWPMEEKPNEARDHPHHTGLYFAHGAVNGKDYWSKVPIIPKRLKHAEGP